MVPLYVNRKEDFFSNDAVLDYFRKAFVPFTSAKSCERGCVGDHSERLVKGADEILACTQVDAGLAAD